MTRLTDILARTRACYSKRPYDRKNQAEKAARRIPGKLEIYQCRFCHRWHLTTKRKRRVPDASPR